MYAACPNYTTLGRFYKHARFMVVVVYSDTNVIIIPIQTCYLCSKVV